MDFGGKLYALIKKDNIGSFQNRILTGFKLYYCVIIK